MAGRGRALPFIGGAVAVWLGSPWTAELAKPIATSYGAVILSFLGGTFLGFAARPVERNGASQPAARALFALSVVPSLIAWIAVLLAPQVALIILAIAFAATLLLDCWSWANGWAPSWWMGLRVPLSVVVLLCLIAIAAAPQA